MGKTAAIEYLENYKEVVLKKRGELKKIQEVMRKTCEKLEKQKNRKTQKKNLIFSNRLIGLMEKHAQGTEDGILTEAELLQFCV